MSKKKPKIMTQEARCGVRLNYVIFPIDFRELRHALAKHGYELSSISGSIPSPPTRIGFGGDIGRKKQLLELKQIVVKSALLKDPYKTRKSHLKNWQTSLTQNSV